jgi:ligand-binding sensor domain-containing protein
MDRKTGRFERLHYDPKKPDQLSRPSLYPGEGRENDKITFIIEDTIGAIWIGTMYSGLNRYDTATKKITHFENNHGYPDSTTWNAFTSRDGELWITTERDNLFRLDPYHKSIDSILTSGVIPMKFLEDKEGYLWVGTLGQGLLKFDPQNKLVRQFKHDSLNTNSLLDNVVPGLFQNKDNVLWVGTDGLRSLNTVTQQFSKIPDYGKLKDSAGMGITNIIHDKQGVMWFGRWGLGLIRYNPTDQTFKHFLSDEKDSTSLIDNHISKIIENKAGVLWIATSNGISHFNRQTSRFKRYLGGTWVNQMLEDSRGNIWAGTKKGLFHYDSKDDKFSTF